jgi:peptidoglycan-associated lipoprotein
MEVISQENRDRRPETGLRVDPRPFLLGAIAALLVVAAPASLGLAAAAPGRQFNSPTLLYETPTADVLPPGTLAISADMTYPLGQTSQNWDYWEQNASIRFSPLKHLDFAVTAYTFSDYVLDARYQLLGGEPDRFGLAVGVYDLGLNSYVSPIGHDTAGAWPDWKYPSRTMENFSAFAVTSIPVTKFARLHFGLGRGRFVGYGEHSRYFNTDIFLDTYHQWAIALFGGVEVYVLPNVALVAEAGSRDLNTGVKASFGPLDATVAWTKMEDLIFAEGGERFGRLYVGASYRFSNLSGLSRLFRRRECAPPEPVPPLDTLADTPPAPPKFEFNLAPIHFDFDKSDIRPGDATILQGNYDQFQQAIAVDQKPAVSIEGYCDPIGTSEYNMALGMRRAEAAKAYLVKLGADMNMFSTISFGEEKLVTQDQAQFEMNRRCEFKVVE